MTILQQLMAGQAYESTQCIELEPAVESVSTGGPTLTPWSACSMITSRLRSSLPAGSYAYGGPPRPRFVLLWPAVTMIRMGEPTFEQTPERRAVRVAVGGGLLVSPMPGASLSIAFTCRPDSLWASVELRRYMPRAVQFVVVDRLYQQTQFRVHEWVGLRYLRLLRRRWLAQTDGG